MCDCAFRLHDFAGFLPHPRRASAENVSETLSGAGGDAAREKTPPLSLSPSRRSASSDRHLRDVKRERTDVTILLSSSLREPTFLVGPVSLPPVAPERRETIMTSFAQKVAVVFVVTAGLSPLAAAAEYEIGAAQVIHGMEVAAVYLQPVEMEPEGMMLAAAKSDIHLEADIHAAADNKNGFEDGTWIPYLSVRYELSKAGGETVSGDLMPMVASDGPHYGDNVKLSGPGSYKLRFTVSPPGGTAHAHFGRHIDRETGVGEWFKPFSVDYEFVFAGTGKKGAY